MTELREIVAIALFVLAIYLVFALFIYPFSWLNLGLMLGCFIAAYVIWPSRRRGQRDSSNWLLDCLEFCIELPVEILLALLRLLGRLFSGKDGDIGLDL